MSEATWISATSDFNKQIKDATPSSNISRQPQAVDKHPSALMTKLSTIETAILKWLSNAQSPNYKSEYMPNADVDTIAHLLLFQIVRVMKLSGGSIAMPCRLSRVRTTMPNLRQG